jgi:probable rRNA maturation factor
MNKINFINFQKSKIALLKTAALAALEAEKVKRYEINFIMVSDAQIRKLNVKYRKVRRITDVISFLVSKEFFIGDVYISKGRSQKNAKAYGNSWDRELVYLVLHGVLHLCGYTDYDPGNKAKMFAKQDKIFQCLLG